MRKEILHRRSELRAEERVEASRRIVERLVGSHYFEQSRVIFAFLPFRDEVAIEAFIEACWVDQKTVFVPKVDAKRKVMQFYQLRSWQELQLGHYGIREPVNGCPQYKGEVIDLVLMPGIAFDRHKGRLGYGAGYYDRFLSQFERKPILVAPAYAMQIVDRVPIEAWDLPVDAIATEKEWIV